MPRKRRDGAPAAEPRKRKLTAAFVQRSLKPEAAPYLTWDSRQFGLAILTQPTGHSSWKVVYRASGRPRWFHIGSVSAIALADARALAAEVMLRVAKGEDPAAARRAERGRGTFEELARRYVEEFSSKRNKSWKQGEGLVRRYAIPRIGKLAADAVVRSDVESMAARIAAPVLANQVLAATSAVFSWGIRRGVVKVNPVQLIDRNPVRSRDRTLSTAEIPQFWAEFTAAGLRGVALQLILLTGQRPGEISRMRHEHIVDGWWCMPGAPEDGWPGTKNGKSHRVWLSEPALALLQDLPPSDSGYVFGAPIKGLDIVMRDACSKLGVNAKATPHDLRRTFATTAASLGRKEFGRAAVDRILNHADHSVGSIYDRHSYDDENREIMERVARHIMALVEGGKVISFTAKG